MIIKKLKKIVHVLNESYMIYWEFLLFYFCFFCKIVFKKKKHTMQNNDIKSILIMRTDKLGDMVVFLPTIKKIRDNFEKSNLQILTGFNSARETIKDCPFIDGILSYDSIKSSRLDEKINILDQIKFIRRLRKMRFDVVFCSTLDSKRWYQSIAFLTGADAIIGFKLQNNENTIFDYEIIYNRDYTDLENNLRLGSLFTTQTLSFNEDIEPWYNFNEGMGLLSQCNISKSDTLILIHPSGSRKTRNWSSKKFGQIISYLVNKHATKIFIIGSTPDLNYGREILSYLPDSVMKNVHNLIGKTHINQLCSIINRSNLLLCVDSGIMHLASFLKKDIIAIFGPGDLTWQPRKNRNFVEVVQSEVDCKRPCFKNECNSKKCLENITVEQVISSVEKWRKSINKCN